MCVCACTCVSVCVGERLRYEGGCLCVDVWEAVIWYMGMGAKADRMRIVIIFVPSIYIYSLLIILMGVNCYTVYFTAHFGTQYYSI